MDKIVENFKKIEKKRLRQKFINTRNDISKSQRQVLDRHIYKNFTLSNFTGLDSFFIYLNFKSEPSTRKIINFLLSLNKEVVVPKIDGRQMRLVYYSKNLQADKLGIDVPTDEKPYEKVPQIALIPTLAATPSGVRLGYGGGYYDKYLKDKDDIIKLGICYSKLIVDDLPFEAHDILLNYILTEKGLIKVKNEKST